MAWFGRREGAPERGLAPMRTMLPFLVRGRNEGAVYFEEVVDVTRTLAFVEEHARATGRKPSLFQIVLAAVVRTLAERPHLNRFVAGGRIRRRRRIELSFAIKRAMRDDAGLTTAKIAFEPEDDLDRVGERMAAPIGSGRRGEETQSDVEMRWVARLPVVLVRLVMWAQRWLDAMGLLPDALVRSDPLYASVFLANLGSIGLDSAYHHLFEYGTCPLFVTMGRVKKAVVPGEDGAPAVRDVVSLKFSFDERIVDGFYCARSLGALREYVEDPRRLVGGARDTG